MRRLVAGLAAVLLLLAACGQPAAPKAEVRVRVVPRNGSVASQSEIRDAAAILDLALGGMNFERRSVLPMADGTVRIVLPESQASRVPEVLERLKDPKLGVEVVR